MKTSAYVSISVATYLSSVGFSDAVNQDKNLYSDLVAPILEAKCVSCHGEDKSKGKLRLDNIEHILEGGNEGEAAIPGKASDSPLIYRVVLPLDDDEHMPPEDEPQLTEAEFDVLTYWISSGAKADAKISDLKPGDKELKFIAAAFDEVGKYPAAEKSVASAKPVPVIDEATKKAVAETIGRVEESGASLMAIAQDTPELRFSALNVQKDFNDKSLEILTPAAGLIRWMDLARTQVTDAGLSKVGTMNGLTRLHLEGTSVTDKGLAEIGKLQDLEYLNLYDTKVTDAGLTKLTGLKNLKKLFVWQTGVTEEGAGKLAAAIPGIEVNTGWKAEEPKLVAAVATKKPEPKKPATPPAPAKKPTPTPTKPEPKPTPKTDPKPAPTKPASAAPAPLEDSVAKTVEQATKTLATAKQKAASARKAATEAVKAAEVAQKKAVEADKEAQKAQEALDLLEKAAAALK